MTAIFFYTPLLYTINGAGLLLCYRAYPPIKSKQCLSRYLLLVNITQSIAANLFGMEFIN
jgi:hypothetical protein